MQKATVLAVAFFIFEEWEEIRNLEIFTVDLRNLVKSSKGKTNL